MTYSDRGVGRLSYGCPTPDVERVYPDHVLVLDGSKVSPITVRRTPDGKLWAVHAGPHRVYITPRRSAALREAKRVANARSRVVAVNHAPLMAPVPEVTWTPGEGAQLPGGRVFLSDDGQAVEMWLPPDPSAPTATWSSIAWTVEDLERVISTLVSAHNHLTTSHERDDENDSQ